MKKTSKKNPAPAKVTTPASLATPAPAAPPAKLVTVSPAASQLAKSAPAVAAPAATPATNVSKPALAAAKTAIVTTAAPITIEAKIDVGFGNNLFVRGQGGGLSWDRGLPLENVDSQTWRLIVPGKDAVQFKLLLNDSVWSKGADVVAAPGRKVEVVPSF